MTAVRERIKISRQVAYIIVGNGRPLLSASRRKLGELLEKDRSANAASMAPLLAQPVASQVQAETSRPATSVEATPLPAEAPPRSEVAKRALPMWEKVGVKDPFQEEDPWVCVASRSLQSGKGSKPRETVSETAARSNSTPFQRAEHTRRLAQRFGRRRKRKSGRARQEKSGGSMLHSHFNLFSGRAGVGSYIGASGRCGLEMLYR